MGKNLTLNRVEQSFFRRNALDISRRLLGKYLVRQSEDKKQIGKIVEVEAYIGERDPACHAFRGLTPRTQVMYGPPGHAYVYFTYGMYFMLNVVVERQGFPAAILIRALEPIAGFEGDDPRPASGPGKLCKNMDIDKRLNGISLLSNELWIGCNSNRTETFDIRWSPRIGITLGKEKLWRGYIFGNGFVSRPSKNQDADSPTLKMY